MKKKISMIGLAALGYNPIMKMNLRKNSVMELDPKTSTKNRLINDQNGLTGRNFRYGLHSAAFNACETIAVHNAKVLLGMDSTLSETIAEFQRSAAMLGLGIFGSDPHAIGRILKECNIPYSPAKLENIGGDGVYIISFWNRNAPWHGLHTVAAEYNKGKFITYNLRGNGETSFDSPDDYARKFICGYYIKANITKERG